MTRANIFRVENLITELQRATPFCIPEKGIKSFGITNNL